MNNVKQTLIDLQAEIKKEEQIHAQLVGKQQYLTETLKETHGCASLKEAKDKITEYNAKIAELEKKLELLLDELEQQMDEES